MTVAMHWAACAFIYIDKYYCSTDGWVKASGYQCVVNEPYGSRWTSAPHVSLI
jgi:hypothetical protein